MRAAGRRPRPRCSGRDRARVSTAAGGGHVLYMALRTRATFNAKFSTVSPRVGSSIFQSKVRRARSYDVFKAKYEGYGVTRHDDGRAAPAPRRPAPGHEEAKCCGKR
ncbi:hypothetical protein EVAR_45480_1 [Eumeta japonica]|uniref:Uncharacterized protein n=1 Tax=Eumeta variegata TaxID=151549 RepID=A0A4C1WH92_EUMVA|nr:hypothetical protein EVAR_45480_1 [Eumeta japonica]